MAIEVSDKCPDCGHYHLSVNGRRVMTASDVGICRRQARIFEEARNAPYRTAIHKLMTEIGYGEENAKLVYSALMGDYHGQEGVTRPN